jgi:hypothetical protein
MIFISPSTCNTLEINWFDRFDLMGQYLRRLEAAS